VVLGYLKPTNGGTCLSSSWQRGVVPLLGAAVLKSASVDANLRLTVLSV